MNGEMSIGEIRTKNTTEINIATEQYLANKNISDMSKNRQYKERQKEISNILGELQ